MVRVSRVRDFRLKAGLTQEDLASHVGISRSALSQIENGHVAPSVYIALTLAKALGHPVERVFTERQGVPVAADRRAGKNIPHVGKQPRSRTKSGAWRRKRSDAGVPSRSGSGPKTQKTK